jgi:hypothetical protein
MSKQVWDVEPAGDGRWKVRREGASRADSHHDRKADAIERARALAKEAPDGQVRVKGRDGQLETEWTYGHDPASRPG